MATFLLCVASNVVLAGLLAVSALVLTRFWRSPHLAHALWMLVLIKLVTPPIVELPLGGFMVTSDRPSPPTELAGMTELPPAGSPSPVGSSSTTSRAANPRLPANDDALSHHRERCVWASFSNMWRVWLLAAWVIGTVGFVGVALRRHARLLALTADGPTPDAAIAQDATHLSRQIGLATCPPLRLTAAHVCPFVTPGMSGPMIVLPSRLLAQLNRDQVNSILAHELAHIRRRDHWFRIFEVGVLALNWWNPIAWWASRQLRQAEEECCDAWVVWVMPEKRRVYGETILYTLEYLTGQVIVSMPVGTAFPGCQLERRIEMVMSRTAERGMSLTALACALAMGMFILPVGPASGPATSQPEATKVVVAHPSAPSRGGAQVSDSASGKQAQGDGGKESNSDSIIRATGVEVFYEQEENGEVRVEHEPPFRVCLEKNGDDLVVGCVYFEGTRVDDASVRRVIPLLGKLPHLRAVEFRDTIITDKSLEAIVRLDTLERLFVRSSVGDEAVPIRLTDAAFESIARLENLKVLQVSNGTINGKGCQHLNSLSKLRVLDLRCTDIDDTTLGYLKGLTHLETVVLWETGITDAGLAHLATLPNLEEVYLGNTGISDKGLKFLMGNKKIRVLDVVRTGVTDASLIGISQLELLTELRLSGTKVSDAGLSHLANLKNLRILELGNTAITDSGLAELESFKQLEDLVVPWMNEGVSKAARERLRQALPECKVE